MPKTKKADIVDENGKLKPIDIGKMAKAVERARAKEARHLNSLDAYEVVETIEKAVSGIDNYRLVRDDIGLPASDQFLLRARAMLLKLLGIE